MVLAKCNMRFKYVDPLKVLFVIYDIAMFWISQRIYDYYRFSVQILRRYYFIYLISNAQFRFDNYWMFFYVQNIKLFNILRK